MNAFNPIGAWEAKYSKRTEPEHYGNPLSYEAAALFLDGLSVVEDWGCGFAYARQFFNKSKYVGVDGSKSKWCDVVDNLLTRNSQPDGILLRHVLEHNNEWERLLENALRCAQRRLVIVFFSKFSDEVYQFSEKSEWADGPDGIPVWYFAEADLRRMIEPRPIDQLALSKELIWSIDTR